MTVKSELGKIGEDVACEYLVKNGYRVLARNYRRKWGEIDAVAKYNDGTLVFFEVKTMVGRPSGLRPEDQATASKLGKVKRTCGEFVVSHPNLLNDKKGWRVDLVAVYAGDVSVEVGGGYLLTKNNKNYIIKHYENV